MIPLPQHKYKIIYADPPWKYEKMNAYEDRKVNVDVYDRMEIDDICNLPINEIADDDSLLFLWVTDPFLEKGLRVLKSWGFDYVTIAFVWIKTYKDGRPITGMGWYTRNATELVLLGKKGKRIHREDMNVHQIVSSAISNHSKKPEEVRNRILKLCGDVKRIELFARQKVDGWDCWGNEIDNNTPTQTLLSQSAIAENIITVSRESSKDSPNSPIGELRET